MMHKLLAAELFNRPHLVEAGRLDALAQFVLSQQDININVPEQPQPQAFAAPDSAAYQEGGYYLDSGIAIIDMIGTMVHRGSWMDAESGITSYNAIARRFDRAMSDPNVNAILLNVDSPGGAVNGAFDLADKIYAARGVKPVEALAADTMASAAYLIPSAAERVHTTQTGQVGSIGVVMKHLDISKWNSGIGINPTYIYAGAHKIEGNPDEPLGKEVRARFQAEVDQLFNMFVVTVDRHTNLGDQNIENTQAAIYLGADAVDIGLVESVTTGEALLEDLKTKHGAGRPHFSSTTTLGSQTMTEDSKPEILAQEQGGTTKKAVNSNEKETLAGAEAGAETKTPTKGAEVEAGAEQSMGASQVIASERTRFAAIMNSDAAKGRSKQAVNLATKTDMSADDVIGMLGDMPLEAKGPSKLDTAMASTDKPNVGAEAEVDGELSASDKILGSYRASTGKK